MTSTMRMVRATAFFATLLLSEEAMFIVCGGGPGLEFFDVLGGDVEEGAAEEGEADEEGVGAVGVGANFALEAGKVAADDADGVVDAELGGGELNGAV